MKKIEVLGSGCPTCAKLKKMCEDIVTEKGIEAQIIYITDINEIVARGIMATPALIIDGELKSAGKIPIKSTLEKWIC